MQLKSGIYTKTDLYCSVSDYDLCNHIPQPFFTDHVFQGIVCGAKISRRIRLVVKIGDDFSFHMRNTVFLTSPIKFHFAAATHTPLEITDTDKAILFRCAPLNDLSAHIKITSVFFEFRGAVRVIDLGTEIRMIILPRYDRIVRIRMGFGVAMICIMAFSVA